MFRRIAIDDRALLVAAGLLALLLVVLTAVLSRSADAPDIPTSYSAGSGGTKALYELLKSSHYPVERWERPLRELPRIGHATLILAEPEANPTAEDRATLRRFMEQGGRVIVTGISGALFLAESRSVPDPIEGLTWRQVSALSPSAATRVAPDITLAPRAFLSSDSSAVPLYGDRDRVRVARYGNGEGDAIWWASATPITNAGASEPGNLEFALANIGNADRLILWDEYVHGYRHTFWTSLIASPLRWVAAQLALLIVAVMLSHTRRSGPIVAEAVEQRRSPLEFVRTLGSLYHRAGAGSVAVDIAYRQFRYGLAQRFSTMSAVPAEHAVRDGLNFTEPAFGELLRACDSARKDSRVKADLALRLTQALWDYSQDLDLFRGRRQDRT
jgi:Domain of unknown function (DUF4350)